MLIVGVLDTNFWFWSDFGMRCVGPFYASVGEKTKKNCFFCRHSHAYITPCPFRIPQLRLMSAQGECFDYFCHILETVLIFIVLIFFVGSQFSHSVCMRTEVFTFLLCFSDTILGQMVSVRNAKKTKVITIITQTARSTVWVEYELQRCLFFRICLTRLALWLKISLHCILSVLRYAIHWFLVFGMIISGGYQRTIRHDCRA